MVKELAKEYSHVSECAQIKDSGDAITSAIAGMPNNFSALSGIEDKLGVHNGLIKKIGEAIVAASEPNQTIQLSSYISVAVAGIGLVVALIGAYLAWRQYVLSVRMEKSQIYRDVLDALWFFALYTGEDPEKATVHLQKIHRVKAISNKAFGPSAGKFIQKTLGVISDLPAQYAAFEKKYTAEVNDAFIKLGIDPVVIQDRQAQEYMKNRVWLQVGIFTEFESIFDLSKSGSNKSIINFLFESGSLEEMNVDKLVNFISGEFFLKYMPNGGAAVLIRTVYISSILYCLAIGLKSYTSVNAIFQFSLEHLAKEVTETIPWLGAILGAVYAALYTRFASQWTYLASLYNQQMEAYFSVGEDEFHIEAYARWQAAFIEDVVNMHMVKKTSFRSLVSDLLDDNDVRMALKSSICFGEKKLSKLMEDLKKDKINETN